MAPRAVGVDLAIALPIGLFVALFVFAIPPIFAIGAGVALMATAFSTRVDIDRLAATVAIITAFCMPMNRLLVGPAPASDVFLFLALAMYGIIRLQRRDPLSSPVYQPVLIGLGLLALGGFIGALFEPAGPFFYHALGEPIRDVSGFTANLGNLAKFVIGAGMPIAFWFLARPGRTQIKRLLAAWMWGASASLFVGFFTGGKIGNRLVGESVHPNQFGSLCLMGLGPALGLLLCSRKLRWYILPVFPILGYGILGSGSRAALGAVVLFALAIGPLTRNRVVMGSLIAGVAIVLAVFLTGLVQVSGENAISRTVGNTATAAGSDQARGDLHREVFGRWLMRPVTGAGFNYMRPSHCVYLGIIASAGALGAVGMIIVVGSIMRRAWRRRADVLALCVTVSYAAYLANAFFDNIFWWRWLWFFVGMVIAVNATDPDPEDVLIPGPTIFVPNRAHEPPPGDDGRIAQVRARSIL